MFEKLLQVFSLSCRHRKTTQPFTASEWKPAKASGDWEAVGSGPSHYVVCLDCGKKFAYDWTNMRMLKTRSSH
jgi:hypothetical protein